MKQLADIQALKKNQELIVLYPDSKLLDIIDRMLFSNIHHVVIVERGTEKEVNGVKSPGIVVGMVSDRDLRLALNTPMLSKELDMGSLDTLFSDFIKQLDENKVTQIMNTHLFCKEADTSVADAIRTMRAQDINSIPIVHKGTKLLAGMITKTDMMDLLMDYLNKDTEVVGSS